MNTCCFDSIYVVIEALHADLPTFKAQINELDLPLSRMLLTANESKKKMNIRLSSLLKERNAILRSIFESKAKNFANGLVSINCAANANYLIAKLWPMPSYVRKKQCENCGDIFVSSRVFLDIDIVLFEHQSVSDLNANLIDTLITERTSNCQCGGSRKLTDTQFSDVIVIDLHLKHHIKAVSLVEIPKSLNILGIRFDIYACIEFIGDELQMNGNEENIGHYVSHICRQKRWERYDDLKSQISKSVVTEKIKAQILFYIKK